jgi:hypothetical protein
LAKLKAGLRQLAARTKEELWQAIGRLLPTIPASECANYLRHVLAADQHHAGDISPHPRLVAAGEDVFEAVDQLVAQPGRALEAVAPGSSLRPGAPPAGSAK